MTARSVRGQRLIRAEDYFKGIMTTELADDELITEVEIPLLPAGTHTGFAEFSIRAGDFAIAMVFVAYSIRDQRVSDSRICVGGAESFPRRINDAEIALTGKPASVSSFEEAALAAAAAIDPLEDLNTTAEYRRALVKTLVGRALAEAA